ncbi:MAG: hypothetical protein EHM59_10220, partial [Betaproteobacteria bacterium]
FAISGHAPADGVTDVGVTSRPRIQLSTAVDPGSVTAASFYASAGGAVLPGTVLVSSDACTAWLYVTGAMPGNSKVEITLEGDLIRSTDDRVLDADGDGTPGGTLRFGFTTVSTVALSGTTLAGRVLDVGPDLLALTPDDVAPGDDGVLGTDDDVFLLPVAGVPVYLMGREQDVVMTDADGPFNFEAVPAGDIKLVIDGPSVTGATTFPQVILDVPLERAAANDLGNIHMPRMALDSSTLWCSRAISPSPTAGISRCATVSRSTEPP